MTSSRAEGPSSSSSSSCLSYFCEDEELKAYISGLECNPSFEEYKSAYEIAKQVTKEENPRLLDHLSYFIPASGFEYGKMIESLIALFKQNEDGKCWADRIGMPYVGILVCRTVIMMVQYVGLWHPRNLETHRLYLEFLFFIEKRKKMDGQDMDEQNVDLLQEQIQGFVERCNTIIKPQTLRNLVGTSFQAQILLAKSFLINEKTETARQILSKDAFDWMAFAELYVARKLSFRSVLDIATILRKDLQDPELCLHWMQCVVAKCVEDCGQFTRYTREMLVVLLSMLSIQEQEIAAQAMYARAVSLFGFESSVASEMREILAKTLADGGKDVLAKDISSSNEYIKSRKEEEKTAVSVTIPEVDELNEQKKIASLKEREEKTVESCVALILFVLKDRDDYGIYDVKEDVAKKVVDIFITKGYTASCENRDEKWNVRVSTKK